MRMKYQKFAQVMTRFTDEISLLSRRVNLLEAAERALVNVTEAME